MKHFSKKEPSNNKKEFENVEQKKQSEE